jgi:hypothetical protein
MTNGNGDKVGARDLAQALGVPLPDNCEVHFVVRSMDVSDQPVGGRVKIADGQIVDTRLRTAMAGTVGTSWPNAPAVEAVR